ncbi:putative Acyl CoA:acetate/3-ketoacid CoA transferase [Vibrio fluvialis]|uniref:Acyl CoA:acetate/3-ketoacid CoA transferase n=1 Tax=Vibrio fluvialis TaxID=676 RepID=A0AAX2LXV9_VIBFL|nr:propionate CoA-transferase [Vibrio fluvialis]MCE7632201.1 propionate CoA-transferase [Vibrio fluvialis]SUQ26757.1 putative Acyl CoA:acetate/3-ketoacid CoA transferase [Vibrio fluvialis]
MLTNGDVYRFRQLLKGVEVIDIASFGSAISPEYLINLLSEASWNGFSSTKYGFIASSLPGAGWCGGFNTLITSRNVDWVIGGFFGTVERINTSIENNSIEVHNIPQGVASMLLSQENRSLQTSIGRGTFLDPDSRGTLINSNYSGRLSVSKRVDNKIEYRLPNSDLILVRGSGLTEAGSIVIETDPIDLDIEQCIRSAKARGAKVVVQTPNTIISNPTVTCSLDLFDGVFVPPKGLHQIGYFPPRYHQSSQNLTRTCDVSYRISEGLRKRIERDEELIVGIGLPVPAINRLRQSHSIMPFKAFVESGMTGQVLYDGDGFGLCSNGKSALSQREIFQKIWDGDIDHAVLGVGDIDANRNIHVAQLGRKFFGVGGFVDISQSVKKLTFCHRKKAAADNLSDISYKYDPSQDVRFITG